MFRKVLIAFAMVAVSASSLAAQDRESRRAEQEARIRELRRELSQLESQMTGFRSLFVAPGNRSLDMEGPLSVMFGVNRARLGVVVQTRKDASVDSIGALIEDVTEGAAAAEAGLQAGDVIISFDGERLTGQYPPASDFESEPAIKLIDLVREHEPGDSVVVRYRRGRNEETATVVLQESGSNSFSYSFSTREGVSPSVNWVTPDGNEPFVSLRSYSSPDIEATLRIVGEFASMELVSLNEELGAYFGTDEGVLVITAPDEEFGLRGGDVILRIGTRNVDDPSRVFRILSSYEPGEEVTIEVMRNQNRETITGTVPERDRGVYRMRTPRR